MPPKKTTAVPAARGRASNGTNASASTSKTAATNNKKSTAPGKSRSSIKNGAEFDLPREIVEIDSDDDDVPINHQRRVSTMDGSNDMGAEEEEEEEGEDEEPRKSIPPALLTALLHEFFEKDGTRITRDANEAVTRYVDVFVREAIARAAVERGGGFLEVEDLEKIAPQLLLDL